MKCPNCNAETMNNICEFCGSEIQRENSQTIINITNNYYSSEPKTENETFEVKVAPKPKKKSNMWLWVLGWICIFPIPLTILLMRNKKMNKTAKIVIIAITWIIYLCIGLSGEPENTTSTDTTTVEATTNSSDNTENEEESTDREVVVETGNQEEVVNIPILFEWDEVVNQFIVDYQAVAGYEMTDISKGNINQKCFCYAGNCYIEILDSLDAAAENVNIRIDFGSCTQEEIMEVTANCLKVFGASDEEVKKTIDDFTVNNEGDYMIQDYSTNNSIICTYVPTKELSSGTTIGRIDIASSTYGK